MTNEVTNEVPENVTESAAPVPGAIAELNINDLVALKNIVDVATSRGAFRANEMSSLGLVYDKLSNFLDQVAKHQPEQPAQSEGE